MTIERANAPRGRIGGTRLLVAILALFILSGGAGLIYEVVWARQLVLVFGNTTQAVSAILTGFFGGMAIGSVVGGRIADRVRSPLRMYAVLELVLVAVVLVTPTTFRLIHELYRGAYGSLESSPVALTFVRFGLSLLALAPATILMGATLPALTRHLTRGRAHLSRAFGRLYAANTVGAILGTLAAGLLLIELFGLSGALLCGAVCSGLAGLLALFLSRREAIEDVATGTADELSPGEPGPAATGRLRLALLVAFASGMTSLGYQVLWTRLLAAGSGNSTYVFTMILAIFLAGIALGAVVFSLVRSRLRDPVSFLAGAQILVGLVVLLGLVGIIGRPPVLEPSLPLESIGNLWQAVVLVVLPATLIMGVSFPASSALLSGGAEHAGRETGQLLAANTVGAIAGSFLVPFLVVPILGSPWATVGLAAVNVAIGLLLALAGGVPAPRDRRILGTAGVAALLVIALAVVRPGTIVDPTVVRVGYVIGSAIDAAAEDEIAAVQAGRIGTERHLWVTGTGMTVLTIDANLMPVIPLIARPQSETAAVVAFGMGSSFRTALVAGLRTDAIELVPSVPRMFGWFHPDAEAVLADPDGRVLVTDGRNHLELTDKRYDIIVTDPPPPIESSGAAVISSLEYYRAGRARLNPGGIMMQWAPYGPGSGDLAAHIRTFRAAFPEVVILRGPGFHGIFMLGAEQPISFPESAIREILGRPGLLENLSEPADSPADDLEAWVQLFPAMMMLDGSAAVDAEVGPGPLVTDDRPYSEYFLLRRTFADD
jgi:spermidine synthase